MIPTYLGDMILNTKKEKSNFKYWWKADASIA